MDYILEDSVECIHVLEQLVNEQFNVGVQGLGLTIPSSYHLLKISLSSRSLLLFYDKPRVYLVGYFDIISFL